VTIHIERSPQKTSSLPPMDENFMQLSSFSNIEAQGEGLIGPLEINLPYDASLPEDYQTGELVVLYPDGTGWIYVPVEAVDGKAVLYTDELGDPLIAWHFFYDKVEEFLDRLYFKNCAGIQDAA